MIIDGRIADIAKTPLLRRRRFYLCLWELQFIADSPPLARSRSPRADTQQLAKRIAHPNRVDGDFDDVPEAEQINPFGKLSDGAAEAAHEKRTKTRRA